MQPLQSLRDYLLQHGKIPFADFMQQALYAPTWGYYTQTNHLLGEKGDFVTAPEITPLFGYTIANQCQTILQHCQCPEIFEFGPGTGRLCIDMLTQLEALNCLPNVYHLLEVSGRLQALQKKNIETQIPHLADRIQWHQRLPTTPFEGVIIANEVLDAMPVHRFMNTPNGLLESMIMLDDKQQLVEHFEPTTNHRLIHHVQKVLTHHHMPYLSEANLFIEGWIEACFHLLKRGVLFIMDYGFPQHEYYHPDRNQGTLMCHFQHQAHTNPLAHPGEEDITAHVDFTHVANAGLNIGFDVAGYTNQASFLLANGLLSFVEQDHDQSKNQFLMKQAIKTLIQPHEMGELFKVIALTKAIDFSLAGFQLHDKRASLIQ